MRTAAQVPPAAGACPAAARRDGSSVRHLVGVFPLLCAHMPRWKRFVKKGNETIKQGKGLPGMPKGEKGSSDRERIHKARKGTLRNGKGSYDRESNA